MRGEIVTKKRFVPHNIVILLNIFYAGKEVVRGAGGQTNLIILA